MNWKNKEIDMLHGPLAGKLLLFTLPIALSSMVQQLFNAADTAVVGYFGSEGALTAVGTNTEIIAFVLGPVHRRKHFDRQPRWTKRDQGAARRGADGDAHGRSARHGRASFGQAAAVPLLRLLQTPEDIFEEAALYLRLYMLGYPFLLLYDFGASALRARGDSRYPFFALMLSGVANVGLNLFFVVVLRMDVAGVAISTGVSTTLSALLVLRRLRRDELFRFTFRELKFSLKNAGNILKTGVPSAV